VPRSFTSKTSGRKDNIWGSKASLRSDLFKKYLKSLRNGHRNGQDA